ncbi:hypothetical protein [Proteiniborus sp.]|uniref:hypothetical protein n=1 Tax=Proteiniborus sp. TaxID=2079015 RepID=UPI00332DCE2B
MSYNNFYDPGNYSNNHNKPNYYDSGNRGGGGSDEIVSIGTWVLILILTGIPIVNIISVLVMAFGVDNENIRNYGKAALILIGIGLVLALLLGACSAF